VKALLQRAWPTLRDIKNMHKFIKSLFLDVFIFAL